MVKKFKENYNTAVITTKFVLEKKSPILFVFLFGDGAWQFVGSEKHVSDNDFRVVSLKEIIEIDNSLLKIAHMPLGSEAIRSTLQSNWRINIEK